MTIAAPLSIGVSGITRQFYVNAFTPPPAQRSNSAVGWGVSGDVFIPVIPAKTPTIAATADARRIVRLRDGDRRHDRLRRRRAFPDAAEPGQASPPPQYTPDVDNGLVTFDVRGVLHTIDWWAAKGAFQYYFPGSGRIFLAGNFTYAHSRNIGKLYPRGGTDIELLGSIADKSLSGDASLFFDATPAVRFGISGQYTQVRYLPSLGAPAQEPYNIRGIAQALYTF